MLTVLERVEVTASYVGELASPIPVAALGIVP